MNERLALDIFDDRRIAARVLEREMDIGLMAVRFDCDRLDLHENIQCLGDRRGIVERVLLPQSCLHARQLRVALPEIGRVEIEHMRGEAALVHPVRRAQSIDRSDQASIFRRPLFRIGIVQILSPDFTPVVSEAPRQDSKNRLG
jgi:hypothetical protein